MAAPIGAAINIYRQGRLDRLASPLTDIASIGLERPAQGDCQHHLAFCYSLADLQIVIDIEA
jgi:hypothetical protein